MATSIAFPNPAVAHRSGVAGGPSPIEDVRFYELVLQQPQCPARASLRRLGTSQGNQLGFLLAIENSGNGRRRSWLAAQYSLEAFFHQLFAHPVNHGCASMIWLSLHPSPASEAS